MPYSAADAQHVALLNELEFKIDEVVAATQQPAIDRSRAYEELLRAARQLFMTAPLSLLYRDSGDIDTTVNPNVVQRDVTAPITDSVSTIIPLPLTFLRFIKVKMKGHVRQVEKLETVNSPKHLLQLNPVTRCDIYHPVAALVPYDTPGTYDQAIEIYPQDTTTNPVEELHVVLEKDPEDVSEYLRDALLWLGAARMFRIFQDANGATMAQQNYAELIQTLNAGVLNVE